MLDIKNFKQYTPPQELIEKYSVSDVGDPLFLCSEDGQDWYECQPEFSLDTVKIMYDSAGVITGTVNANDAVSMLWPIEMSVAEVECLPPDFVIDGIWSFIDGNVVRNEVVVKESNRKLFIRKIVVAAGYSWMYESCMREGDDQALSELNDYANKLRDVDLKNPEWPAIPACML